MPTRSAWASLGTEKKPVARLAGWAGPGELVPAVEAGEGVARADSRSSGDSAGRKPIVERAA